MNCYIPSLPKEAPADWVRKFNKDAMSDDIQALWYFSRMAKDNYFLYLSIKYANYITSLATSLAQEKCFFIHSGMPPKSTAFPRSPCCQLNLCKLMAGSHNKSFHFRKTSDNFHILYY